MEEHVEPIRLIDFKNCFDDVDSKRRMDIWDWLVYNGHVIPMQEQ